jgi:hypothetical protein
MNLGLPPRPFFEAVRRGRLVLAQLTNSFASVPDVEVLSSMGDETRDRRTPPFSPTAIDRAATTDRARVDSSVRLWLGADSLGDCSGSWSTSDRFEIYVMSSQVSG